MILSHRLKSVQDFSFDWVDSSQETCDSNHRVKLGEKFNSGYHDSNHELCDLNLEGKLCIEFSFSHILGLEI